MRDSIESKKKNMKNVGMSNQYQKDKIRLPKKNK